MKKGETALLTIQPDYAFGASESQQELATVPANATVFYEVELTSFTKVSVIGLWFFGIENRTEVYSYFTWTWIYIFMRITTTTFRYSSVILKSK